MSSNNWLRFFVGKGIDKKFPLIHSLGVNLLKLFQRSKFATYKTDSGALIEYDPSLSGVGFFLSNFNEYEPYTTSFLSKLIKNTSGDFIDAGANVGYYTIIAGKINPKIKILAIEPETVNLGFLKRNIQLNKIKNVQVFEGIANNRTGKATLFISPNSSGEHSTVIKNNKKLLVNSTTIDELVKKLNLSPSIIKIDVEGAEGDVIKGSIRTINKYRPDLIFEYSLRNKNNPSIFKQLSQNGYHFLIIDEKNKRQTLTSPEALSPILKDTTYVNLFASTKS